MTSRGAEQECLGRRCDVGARGGVRPEHLVSRAAPGVPRGGNDTGVGNERDDEILRGEVAPQVIGVPGFVRASVTALT